MEHKHMTDYADMADQISRLRTEIQRLRWVCIFAILFLFGLIFWSQRNRTTVEAREFLLKDEAGNVVARMGKEAFSHCLSFKAKSNSASASLCVGDDDSSSLFLSDHQGTSRVSLSPGFNIYEPPGRFPPGLYIGENDGANYINYTLGDETKMTIGHGSSESVVVSSSRAKSEIKIYGENGKTIWKAP
jgi:hypothetical protein